MNPEGAVPTMRGDMDGRPSTILLIDDEPLNLQMIKIYLGDYGFEMFTALDGATGIAMARRQRPDLILLDVLMPGMDGFQVCRLLKEDPVTAPIPVLFFSALTAAEDKARGFAVGGIDYVTKPVQQPELLARVTTHINQQRAYSNMLGRLKAYQERFGPLPVELPDQGKGEALDELYVRRVYRARELLEKDLVNPPSLGELAAAVGTNTKRLSRDFQILYGMPVFAWLREHRLQRAQDLLRTSHLPVERIAESVGYGGGANFATAFKRRFNITPRKYRAAQAEVGAGSKE